MTNSNLTNVGSELHHGAGIEAQIRAGNTASFQVSNVEAGSNVTNYAKVDKIQDASGNLQARIFSKQVNHSSM